MSECGCKVNYRLIQDGQAERDMESFADRSACSEHSDAALAAKESRYQANMEDLRQQRDSEVANCAKQLQAMFDREQLATKSAESLSCMVEQLKLEAANRIVEAARLREEIVVQRRDGIAKDERIRELESKEAALKHAVYAVEQTCRILDSKLSQLRQQVEAEVREDDAKIAESYCSQPEVVHRLWSDHHDCVQWKIAAELRRRLKEPK